MNLVWKSEEKTTIEHCGHIGINNPQCTCKEETEVNYTCLTLDQVKEDLDQIKLSELSIYKDNSITLTLESEKGDTLTYSEIEYRMNKTQLINLIEWMKS